MEYIPLPGFELKRGDILVKDRFDWDPACHIINLGQAVMDGKQYSNYVHAAIALNAEYIAESQSDGVVRHSLKDNLGHGYKYQVFRHKNERAADLAARWAEEQVEMKPGYSFSKAFGSLFKSTKKEKSLESVPLLGDNQLFCSEFAVDCYNRTCDLREQEPFTGDSSSWNPSALYGYLKNQSIHFIYVGPLP